jgi:hypothetical protein
VPTNGHIAAGEHEPLQVRRPCDLEDVAGAVDVGAEQRGRVTQPRPGVHHAVVDDIHTGHRVAQGVGVEDVTLKALQAQIVDADRVGIGPDHDPHIATILHELARDV